MSEAAKWYIIHTYSGYENKVKQDIEKVVENRKLHDLILEVQVPTETVTEITDGKTKELERKLFPGYVFLKMVYTDDTWHVVKNIRGATGFVGPGSEPTPLSEEEVAKMGVDIGGTAVKLGLVDETGRVLRRAERSVSFDGYETPVLTTVRKAAKEFLTAQNVPVESLTGIGVSATGQIDSRKGIVAGTCGNFPNYINSPIQAELERLFGLPVTVANDANCMTLGEVWVGGAKGYTDVIGVTLGTGVGGGILTGGRLLEGARGLGGELGHYRTHALDGVPCTCGATGCWERYAATTALVRAAKERDPALVDGRAIFAAAEAGDKTVLALLDDWTDEIAQGLAGMVHIFNPQLILIGGGVSAQQALLIDPLAAQVRKSIMPAFAEGLEVRAAALQNDAGLVGAVYYFKQQRD